MRRNEGRRWRSVVLAELVAALGAVVEDSGTLVGGPELEGVEVHLVITASRALFLDCSLGRAGR